MSWPAGSDMQISAVWIRRFRCGISFACNIVMLEVLTDRVYILDTVEND
jgi:hypothetical protein